jgi:hypothetical protein
MKFGVASDSTGIIWVVYVHIGSHGAQLLAQASQIDQPVSFGCICRLAHSPDCIQCLLNLGFTNQQIIQRDTIFDSSVYYFVSLLFNKLSSS